jgi:hypothetical protein
MHTRVTEMKWNSWKKVNEPEKKMDNRSQF